LTAVVPGGRSTTSDEIQAVFSRFGDCRPDGGLPRAEPPDVEALLDKASDYVAEYERTFVGVVAEETYRQQARVPGGRVDVRGFPSDTMVQRRDLKSDVLLVRAPAGDRWIQFRDVFEVDGKPVRDRDERLTKLFLQPSADARRQEEDIAAASARYNIGDVNRTVNLPMLALTVLDPGNRPGFRFARGNAPLPRRRSSTRKRSAGTR